MLLTEENSLYAGKSIFMSGFTTREIADRRSTVAQSKVVNKSSVQCFLREKYVQPPSLNTSSAHGAINNSSDRISRAQYRTNVLGKNNRLSTYKKSESSEGPNNYYQNISYGIETIQTSSDSIMSSSSDQTLPRVFGDESKGESQHIRHNQVSLSPGKSVTNAATTATGGVRSSTGRLRRHVSPSASLVPSPMTLISALHQKDSTPSPLLQANTTSQSVASALTTGSSVTDTGLLCHESFKESCAGASSLKGLKPGRPHWINQDNFFVTPSRSTTSEEVQVYCVLDGHGEDGHLVSSKCKTLLSSLLTSTHFDIKKTFALTQQSLLESREFNANCSGATCVLIVLSGYTLLMAHCGDSRAVLGRRSKEGLSHTSSLIGAHGYIAEALTEDHKPDRPDEYRRIIAAGGFVGSRQSMMEMPRGHSQYPHSQSSTTISSGPCRVWYRNGSDTLGLAMSRSLGDGVVHTCGVSAEPEISTYELDPNGSDEFIIIATDGLWDVIDSAQAVRIVGGLISRSHHSAHKTREWSPEDASQYLVTLARRKWEQLSTMVDDITCVVVRLPNTETGLSHSGNTVPLQ